MLRSAWLLILLLPWAPSLAAEDASNAPVVMIVGDSLSAGFGLRPGEGWVSLLEQRLGSQGYPHRVINASISGDTTRGALARLPRALKVHHPDIVVIELGGNDGLRGFQPDVMRENLEQLINMSRKSGADVLLLGMRLPANYGPYTETFHQVFLDIARERKVPFLPFFLEGVAMRPGLMQADGIHPNAEAQQKLLDNVWPRLEPLLAVSAPTDSTEQ